MRQIENTAFNAGKKPDDKADQFFDLTGVLFIKEINPPPMLNVTRLARRAAKARAMFETADSETRKMLSLEIQAWNLAWQCIKRSRPALAELLHDENVKAICKAFDAEIQIEA